MALVFLKAKIKVIRPAMIKKAIMQKLDISKKIRLMLLLRLVKIKEQVFSVMTTLPIQLLVIL
ncbi:hypothetical protein D3C71_1459150 [compost metagenome]|jgi:hypothetical protein